MKTGGLDWITISEELVNRDDIIRVKENIESIQKPDRTLIQVRLSGILNMEDQPEVEHLRQILDSRFFWSYLDTSQLAASPTDQSWIDDLGPGIIQQAAQRLLQLSANDPEVTQLALSRTLHHRERSGEMRAESIKDLIGETYSGIC